MKRLAVFLLLGLVGCPSGTATPPPPPPTLGSATAQWSGTGNPLVSPCVNSTRNCLSSYTLKNLTEGKTFTGISVSALTYTETGIPIGTYQYSLVINGIGPTGGIVTSPPLLLTVTAK